MPYASHSAEYRTAAGGYGNRFFSRILATFAGLFALRILAQALQRWAPVPFLPPFEAFQGSNMPYALLLSIQLAILAMMVGITSRVHWGALRKNARSGRVLVWLGGLYLVGSLARLGVGLAMPEAGAWMRASIPAFFHVVLAAFVLTLAAYHARRPAKHLETGRP